MSPPVIICGAHGGGTSFLTKLLRFCGFWAGADAGSLESRKFHESRAYKAINRSVGEACGDPDLMTEPGVAAATTELSANLEQWVATVQAQQSHIQSEFGSAHPPPSRPPTSTAQGIANTLLPSSPKTWPGMQQQRLGIRPAGVPWGWKDPRNSITLPLWRTIYPEARVLVIVKQPDKRVSKSSSGSWFRDPQNQALVTRYQNPQNTDDLDVFRADFYDSTGRQAAFNSLLTWLDLPNLSARKFDALLQAAAFEQDTPS